MDIVSAGVQSKLLKENTVFQYAIDELKKDMFNRWLNSEVHLHVQREEIYKITMCIELFKTELDRLILKAENELLSADINE